MREKLTEVVKNIRKKITAWHTSADIAEMLVANDVVPVVRCKACKNNGQCSIQDAMNWTPKTEIVDYFCSYGERKDNE